MKKRNKIIAGIVGFLLPLMPGCNFLSNLPPNHPKQPKVESPLDKYKEPTLDYCYENIPQPSKIIVDSIKEDLPEGLVAHLKKDNQENEIYIAIRVENKTLNLTVYRCSDPEIKEKLKTFYLFEAPEEKTIYSIKATTTLEQNYNMRVEFNDEPPYGIRMSNKKDYEKSVAKGGTGEITFQGGKLMQTEEVKENNPRNLEDHLLNSNRFLLDVLIRLVPEKKEEKEGQQEVEVHETGPAKL